MFLLWLRQLPPCGDQTPASVPPLAEGRSSPTKTPIFPPSPFVLLSFAWFCMFFSTDQALLSTLSWCSACTFVSEAVFLMHLWRETYSMSTYSSAIFVSAHYLIGLFVSLILSCMSCLYISEINPLSVASLANIFSYSEGCTLNFEHAASSIWTSLPPSISLLALYSSLNVSCVFWFWSDF